MKIYKSQNHEYKIIKQLGKGETGITYLVEREDKTLFVLKELKIDRINNWKAYERFKSEINFLKSLANPHIPQYIDFIENENLSYIQEYIKGDSLETIINKKISLPKEKIKKYLLDALETIDYIQNLSPPLIHRDISPKNIIVNENNLYLIDLGVALSYDDSNSTVTTAGTFGYMAPEQIMGKPKLQSDIYSMGMTFIALLNQTTVENLAMDVNNNVDIKKSTDFLPTEIKDLLIKMTQAGLKNRLTTPLEGINHLKNKKLITLNDSNKNKTFINKKFLALSFIIICNIIFGFYRYHSIINDAKYKKTLGSFTQGYTSKISLLKEIYLYKEFYNKNSITFLKLLPDYRLFSYSSEKVILWDLKTENIIWQTTINNYYTKTGFINKENNQIIVTSFDDYDKYLIFDLKNLKKIEIKHKLNKNKLLIISKKYYPSHFKNILNIKLEKIYTIKYSPQRKKLLFTKKKFVVLYDENTNKELCKVYHDYKYTPNIFISDKKEGFFAINNKIYNSNCKLVSKIDGKSDISALIFVKNDKEVIFSQKNGLIRILELKNIN